MVIGNISIIVIYRFIMFVRTHPWSMCYSKPYRVLITLKKRCYWMIVNMCQLISRIVSRFNVYTFDAICNERIWTRQMLLAWLIHFSYIVCTFSSLGTFEISMILTRSNKLSELTWKACMIPGGVWEIKNNAVFLASVLWKERHYFICANFTLV